MKIPQLQVQTTKAELALRIQQPQQHIEQPQAEMHIEQQEAELNIQTTSGKLQIDQTQLRADLGLYTFREFARNAAQKGVQDILAGIARRSREGQQLMSIEKGNNAIESIIDARTLPKQKQLGIDFIPSANSVKLSYTPAEVQIDVQRHEPNIDVKANKPIHQYTPGKVLVNMKQMPSVTINWLV